jgi:DNA-binding XRE family transcriptional regulator
MPGKRLPYGTTNIIAAQLNYIKAKRMVANGGKEVKLEDLENELATHCDLQRSTVVGIKRNVHQPSLPVAMKVIEWFNVQNKERAIPFSVEELFKLVDASDIMHRR